MQLAIKLVYGFFKQSDNRYLFYFLNNLYLNTWQFILISQIYSDLFELHNKFSNIEILSP